jgi:uncharacterized protein YunC (DUF1805 family)
MSSNMQQFSDMKAELAELASEFAQFKATQPNLEQFAGRIGEHLVRFEAEVSHNFIDKFAGNFFRATTSITERVVNLEERQVRLEETLRNSEETYRKMLADHRREVAELHRAHLAAVKKLIDENGEQLKKQQATVARLLKSMQGYDEQFVTLINACGDLQQATEQSTQQIVAKVDAAVQRFDQISTGTLKEVATQAQLSIKQIHDDAQRNIVKTRTRFNKIMCGFDSKLSEHPVLLLVLLVAMFSFTFGLVGNVGGRWLVKENAQQMIDESVAGAQDIINQRVDEKIDTLKEISDRLNTMVDDAQYWDALTANMTYEQKLAYIQAAQEQAKRQGRTLRVSNGGRQEPRKR